MTLPRESASAVKRTYEFLRFIAGIREEYPGGVTLTKCRIPKAVREEARRLLRHYPVSDHELREIRKGLDDASNFAEMVAAELCRARAKHANQHSAHEAFAVLLEEVEEFKAEVFRRREHRDPQRCLAELIQVAAMAQRAAEDVFEETLRWEGDS